MAGDKAIKLTRFEMEIMEAVWQLGSGSVREIQEALAPENRPAYTTVQTIIYRLEEKGAVRRVKKIGNAHIFEPVITRQSAKQKIVNELLDLFGGSARPLMASSCSRNGDSCRILPLDPPSRWSAPACERWTNSRPRGRICSSHRCRHFFNVSFHNKRFGKPL